MRTMKSQGKLTWWCTWEIRLSANHLRSCQCQRSCMFRDLTGGTAVWSTLTGVIIRVIRNVGEKAYLSISCMRGQRKCGRENMSTPSQSTIIPPAAVTACLVNSVVLNSGELLSPDLLKGTSSMSSASWISSHPLRPHRRRKADLSLLL